MKKITTTLSLILLIVLCLSGCSSDEISKESALADTKKIVFEDFGSKTLDEAANASLENVKWECNDTPEYENDIAYTVNLSGVMPEDSSEMSIDFKIKYEYRNNNSDPIHYSVSTDSVSINGELLEGEENITEAMMYLYKD